MGLSSGTRGPLATPAAHGLRAAIQITVLHCLLAHSTEMNGVCPGFFLWSRLEGLNSLNCGLIGLDLQSGLSWCLNCRGLNCISSATEEHGRLRCEAGRLPADVRQPVR